MQVMICVNDGNCLLRVLGLDPLQLFLKGSGHITHYVMIIIRYRPLRCSYKPLLLLAYIKALPWVAIVYSKSRWMDGYVHMIKEVLGRQHRKKSAAHYSFAECQYSRLLKVIRLVNFSAVNREWACSYTENCQRASAIDTVILPDWTLELFLVLPFSTARNS